MELHRAQEILQSDAKIGVELHGISVWIDSVDADKSTAKVHDEENPGEAQIVPIEQLEEVH